MGSQGPVCIAMMRMILVAACSLALRVGLRLLSVQVGQAYMHSCSTKTHALRPTRAHVLLWSKTTCVPVEQECMNPLEPQNVYSASKTVFFIVEREDMIHSVDLGIDVAWLSRTLCVCVLQECI